MGRLGRLEDIEALKHLKARYFRCIDAKQWDEVEALFWPHAEITATVARDGTLAGFLTSLRNLGDGVTTFHAGHMPELDVRSDGTAGGRWAMSFHLQWDGDNGPEGIQGFRFYEDEYLKSGGEWRISAMRISATDADPLATVRATAAPSAEGPLLA
jgi:hypothetical protein